MSQHDVRLFVSRHHGRERSEHAGVRVRADTVLESLSLGDSIEEQLNRDS